MGISRLLISGSVAMKKIKKISQVWLTDPDILWNMGRLDQTELKIWVQLFKITTSLVNFLLKFQTLISEIRQYFLLKKKCDFLNKKYQCIWLYRSKTHNKLAS